MVSFSRSLCSWGTTGLLALAFCVLLPRTGNAQIWVRTAQIVAPIEPDGPTQTLLDTLLHVAGNDSGITVRRLPEQREKMSLSTLRDSLNQTFRLDVTDADHLMVGYRFSIVDGEGFKWQITDLQFLYRGTHETEDFSLLYMDAQDKWVQSVLRNKGTSFKTNQANFLTFRDQLSFITLTELQEADVVEIGGQTIHEGFDVEKRALIQQIHYLTYSDVYNDVN